MDKDFNRLNLHRPVRKKAKRFKWVLVVVILIIGFSFLYSFLNSTSTVFNYAFPKVFSINPLKSTDDRVNVLLLGNAGGHHDGATLTDSIIVASYHLKSKNVTLISIPRDMWVDSAKAKINTLYQHGIKDDTGLKFAEDKIDDLLGFPIHYGVRLDFAGFAKAIDLVEGVEVNVPKTFDDYTYPIEGKENDLCGLVEKEVDLTEEQIKALSVTEDKLNPIPDQTPNPDPKGGKKYKVLVDQKNKIATSSADFACRFEHIHFEKGSTKMDGESALKFVRSRQGTSGEGSDFARSRRQQLVIQSFRNKALSLETLFNPQKVSGLISTFGESFETDIPIERVLDFYNLIKKINKIESLVLGDLGGGNSILYTPPPSDFGGAFVLIPKNNNFSMLQEFIKLELEKAAQINEGTK